MSESRNPQAYRMTLADPEGLAALTDPKILARFWSKVDKSTEPDGCWIWTGGYAHGYGRFSLPISRARGLKGGNVIAARFSYALVHGPIPLGLELDHEICSHPPCIRPDHLTATTPRKNLLRGETTWAAKNACKTECPKGHPYSGDNLRLDKDGRRGCLACRTEKSKTYGPVYHATHREQISTRKRLTNAAYYWINREKILAQKRASKATKRALATLEVAA